MKKGTWYYEIQILMFVIMWLHNANHKPTKDRGLWIGRLHIWYDTAWTRHGLPGDIRNWFTDNRFLNEIRSLQAYWTLHEKGFRIGHYIDPDETYERWRFFWKDKMIQEFPDLNRVNDHYSTTNKGHVEHL